MAIEQIVIEPDGTVKGLCSDDLIRLLRGLGPVEVMRASHVEYDNALGGWTVQVEVEPRPLVGTFRYRAEALQWERAYLDVRLAGGSDVEGMIVASRSLRSDDVMLDEEADAFNDWIDKKEAEEALMELAGEGGSDATAA